MNQFGSRYAEKRYTRLAQLPQIGSIATGVYFNPRAVLGFVNDIRGLFFLAGQCSSEWQLA